PSMSELVASLRGRTSARRKRSMIAVLIAFSALGGVFAGTRLRVSPRAACVSARPVAAWDPTHRAAVHRAFLATGKPYAEESYQRVDALLNQYTKAWESGYSEACDATHLRHQQSEALLDARMQCLHRRRGELAALVKLFEEEPGDKMLKGSASAVQDLASPAVCGNVDALLRATSLPPSPEARRRIEEVRSKLDAVEAVFRAGLYER